MTEIDDLETNLACDHSGSARKIRAGRKLLALARNSAHERPRWQQQLRRERKKAPITLAGQDNDR